MASSKKALALVQGAKRVINDIPKGELGKFIGVPPSTFTRPAKIYVPVRTSQQQGTSKALKAGQLAWKIAFDTQGKWENPLIGWTSTADPLDVVSRHGLAFDCKEAAIAFCEKHGWEYTVEDPPEESRSRPKRFAGYGDNFSVKRKGFPVGGLRSESFPAE